jgi:AcrR family transcriptional regulator
MVTDRIRLSADDRRSCILEAGRHTFARKGFHGTSTAELAARAGCSEPTLYKYFPSKQAVFAAVLDDATRCITVRVAELMRGAEDPLEVPLLAIAQQAATDELIVEVVRLRMLAVSLVEDDEIRAALARSAQTMRSGMVARLAASRTHGRVRDDIDLETAAWLWLGMTLAGGFAYALDPEEARELVPRMAGTFVTMLRPLEESQEI